MTRRNVPAIVGLAVAWGGTAFLVSPAARFLTGSPSLMSSLWDQVVLWFFCAVVVGIVVFWEQQRLTSLWLRPFQWQSMVWAGVLIAVSLVVLFPLTEWVRMHVGLSGYARGMETALAYPIWFRIFSVFTAGVVEEFLLRGFVVTRLLALSGSLPLAVILSSAVFAGLHLPMWGLGPSLAFFIGSLAMTAFFVWRRDLLAMIIAHIAVDLWGLVISPSFSSWWE